MLKTREKLSMIVSNNLSGDISASIYLFKVSNVNTRTMCKICSKFTIKTLERRKWRRSGAFTVNSEHISHAIPVFVVFEQINVGWDVNRMINIRSQSTIKSYTSVNGRYFCSFNPFIHNTEKRSNTIFRSCDAHATKF